MSMNESVVLTLIEYVDECLFEPKRNWPRYYFDQRAYSRWAADEIITLIMDCPFVQADILVEEFMLEMDYYSCMVLSEVSCE